MLSFTREQRGQAFDTLSKDLKRVVTSDALAESFQKIGASHSLTIDKVGIMADVVTLAILGLIPKEKISETLSKEASISSPDAEAITSTVNREVFLKIREILMREDQASDVETKETIEGVESSEHADDTTVTYPVGSPNKNDILAEIENPTPVEHPISIAQQAAVPAMPRPQEIVSEPTRTSLVPSVVAKDFVAAKLSGTANLPSVQNAVDPDKFAQKPKGYEADPYREAIN